MSSNEQYVPVLWALGNKGFITLKPLIAALNIEGRALAVTSNADIYINDLAKSNQLLLEVEIPTNISTGIKFIANWFRNRHELTKLLNKKASVIHIVMGSPWDLFFLNAAKRTKCPIVLTIHDAHQHLGEESILMDAIRKWSISKVDHIAVLSNHVKESLQQRIHINKPIHIVENGILSKSEPALSPRIYPNNRPLKLLFHGRIHDYKGLDILLDALQILQAFGHRFSLTIAGAGDLSKYRQSISDLKNITIQNNFISSDDMLSILATHDIAVLPYREASQSGVAMDALWAAMPSIATTVGALPKQLNHEVDTLLLKTFSANELANAIIRLSSDKQLYEALSLGAFRTYQYTGPTKAAQQWNDLYKKIRTWE